MAFYSMLQAGLLHHPICQTARTILKDRDLCLLYVDIRPSSLFDKAHNINQADEWLRFARSALTYAVHHYALDARVDYIWDHSFIALLPLSATAEPPLHAIIEDAVSWIEQHIPQTHTKDMHLHYDSLRIAAMGDQSMKQTAAILYDALVQVARLTHHLHLHVDPVDSEALLQIVRKSAIVPVYQPIIDLQSGRRVGFEALARGPENSPLHLPDRLFACAEQLGELFSLEQLCREKALEQAPLRTSGEWLFLNIHPQTLNDPQFVSGRTRLLAEQSGVAPEQIVIEITEHQAIHDYATFRKTVAHYRRQGYRIAVDDMGAGHSGLQTLIELTPDFIKLDKSLVQGVHHESVKRALIEAMVTVAGKTGSGVIAEGIENEEDLQTLRTLGAAYGQGFHLGRPAVASTWLTMQTCHT